MSTSPGRIERKPIWIEQGRMWHTSAAGKLYLEDLIFIFDIMQDYSNYSPFLLRMRRSAEAIGASQKVIRESRLTLGDETSDLPPTSSEAEPPVVIEADDYIVHSIDDLVSLNLGAIRDFSMSVGYTDLGISCRGSGTTVKIGEVDPKSEAAFNEIRTRIQKRQVPILRLLHNMRTFLIFLGGTALLTFTSAVIDNSIISAITTVSIFVPLLYLAWMFTFWDRRAVTMPEHRKT